MLTAPRRLLLVHAHPDDETLWTGGLIARYAAEGVEISVVTCTLGEQGEVIPDELRGLAVDQADQLGGYRVGELRAACSALGVRDHRFLGGIGRWRDSGMVVEPGGRAGTPHELHARSFVAGEAAEQVDELARALTDAGPQVVVTYGPDGGYGHPDHVRAHEVTMAAVARVPEVTRVFWAVQPASAVRAGITRLGATPGLPFPVPAPGDLPGSDDAEVTTRVDVSGQQAAVLAAMRAHRTQVTVWEDDGHQAFALSDGVARPVLDTAYLTLVRGPADGADDDLFGGLPVTDQR